MNLVIACILGFVIGFAAHRASICTVRGVAEIFYSRTGHMLWTITKTMLWVVAITLPFFWLTPSAANISGWQLTIPALLGGFIFGIGAGINGACAYSTMAYLADGQLRMLATIGGFILGVVAFVTLVQWQGIGRPQPGPALIGSVLAYAAFLSAIFLAWATFEAWRIYRDRRQAIGKAVLAPQYRLSVAAMLMGIAGATLLLMLGPMSYTATFEVFLEWGLGTRPMPSAARLVVLVAVLTGMFASTIQRGSFRFDWRPRAAWLRNGIGGVLMGFGVALTPGGNDAFVLYAIPSLSPHALPAFVAMMIGIALALVMLRTAFGIETRASCRDDLFYSDATPVAAPPGKGEMARRVA